MAVEANQEAAGGRLVLLGGLTALGVTAALAFGRVYQGHGTTLRLVLVAAISVLLAAGMERRNLALATLVSAVGLIVFATLLVFPETTTFGLPTLRTLHAGLDAFSSVARTSNAQVAPAPPFPPLLIAGVTAAWTAAFAAHSLAVRANSPLLAIAPPAALMTFAGIVLDDGARPMYVFLFLFAALAVLFADALRRVAHWGPVTVWHERSWLRAGSGTTVRAAWRVAAGCLAVALFTPWVLPGFRSSGLLSLRGGLAQHVSIDPIVDLRPRLLQNPAAQLFTVQSEGPAYWRFYTADTFDGREWKASDTSPSRGFPVIGTVPAPALDLPCANPNSTGVSSLAQNVPTTCPPGYPDNGPTVEALHQHFTFGGLAMQWLPAAAGTTFISLQRGTVRYDSTNGSLIYPDVTYTGFSYSVTSVEVVPTPAELNAIPSLQTPENPDWERYTALPAGIPPPIKEIAERQTANATTPYEQVMALQQYLRGFTYDLKVKSPPGVNDLLYFLTKSHRGFCEQFAGALAVMLRSLGIPARVAVGFTPGTFRSGAYHVSTQNAHAWVEVEFPQYGWLAFEPTPGRTNPVATLYNTPPGPPLGGAQGCLRFGPRGECITSGSGTPSKGEIAAKKGGSVSDKLHNPDLSAPPFQTTSPAPKPAPLADRLRSAAIRLAWVLLVLLIVGTPIVKAARRRILVPLAREPNARVVAAYRLLDDLAADVGMGRMAFETPVEYERRIAAAAEASRDELSRLTELAMRASYDRTAITEREAADAPGLARRVAREIRRSAPAVRRIAGIYRIGAWEPGERWLAPAQPGLRAPVTFPSSLRA
jgi:transglutaminase-like putative cysteine protease